MFGNRADLVGELTASQRQTLVGLMQQYLKDPVVAEHFWAHGGLTDPPSAGPLHAFTSHRELIMACEDFLGLQVGGTQFIPLPAWDPALAIPNDPPSPTFRDIRAPDDVTVPNPPWPVHDVPGGGSPVCPPPIQHVYFPPPTIWPALVNFGPFDGTGGTTDLRLSTVVPSATPGGLCGSGIQTTTALWTAIRNWHDAVHDAVGGSLTETAASLVLAGHCYHTEPFREAAYIFLPWHAYIDSIYWNYQHCAGHGVGPAVAIPGWFGTLSQGGAIDVADIDANGQWDLIVMHVDHTGGSNQAFYRVGWNLDASGNVTQWSGPFALPDPIGASTQGGGVAVANIRGVASSAADSGLDVLVFWVEVDGGGAKHGRYRIGWNLDPATGAPRGAGGGAAWSAVMTVFDPFTTGGNTAIDIQGVGVALGDFGTGQMRLVVFRVEHPTAGVNQGWYQIGSINAAGVLSGWTGDQRAGPPPGINVPPGMEDNWFTSQAQGADVTIANTHNDGPLDLVFFYIDHSTTPNWGFFRIGYHVDPATGVPEQTHGYLDQDGFTDSTHPGTHGFGRTWAVPLPGPGSFTEMGTRPADNPANRRWANFGTSTKGAGIAFVGDEPFPGSPKQNGLKPFPPFPAATTHGWGQGVQGDLIFFHLDAPTGSNHGYYRVGHALDINGEFS